MPIFHWFPSPNPRTCLQLDKISMKMTKEMLKCCQICIAVYLLINLSVLKYIFNIHVHFYLDWEKDSLCGFKTHISQMHMFHPEKGGKVHCSENWMLDQ